MQSVFLTSKHNAWVANIYAKTFWIPHNSSLTLFFPYTPIKNHDVFFPNQIKPIKIMLSLF